MIRRTIIVICLLITAASTVAWATAWLYPFTFGFPIGGTWRTDVYVYDNRFWIACVSPVDVQATGTTPTQGFTLKAMEPWLLNLALPTTTAVSAYRKVVAGITIIGTRFPCWTPIVLFGTYPLLALIRGPLRRRRRRKLGLCIPCGYNLTGNTTGRCPECNEKIQL